MATKKRKMEIVIAGDPKGGVAAFGALSDSADTFGGKLGKMSLAAGAAFAAVGATAGVALVKIGSDFQQGFRDIQVATGATGEALEALKADAKAVMSEVPDSFETVAQGIGILNTAFGESGEALQALSVQAIDASRILKEDAGANMKGLGKVANQFGLDAQGAGVLLDDLFKVTQDFGVGLGPLQEQLRNYGPIFQNIGFDASETSVIMGQFSKAGIDIAKVSPALNKFSRDVAAVGGDPMTALLDITQAINDAASTTDALNIASDAFGAEGAQRMVTAVRDAGVGFEDLQDALAGSEGGIALAAEQTATLGEKWREFTNKVLVQLEPVATRVFGFVMDAMDRLGPIAEQATAALAPFLEILGGSGSIGEKLSGLWTEAQPHLAEFKDRFVQWVKDITPPLLREAGRMATKFGRWIKDQAPEWAAQLVEWGKAFVEWVVPMIPPALEKLVEFATAAADWMLETGLPLLVEKLVEWGKAFVEWVVPMIPPLLLELGKILVSLGEWVLTSAVPKIAALGVDLAGAMLGFIKNDVLPALPGLLADVLGAIVDWATGPALTKIGEVASDIGSALGDGISAAFKGGLNALIDAWNGLEFTTPSVEAFGRTIGGFTIGTPDIARFGADGGSAGGAGSVPRLHDGGMFRTSNPSGEGLAMLQDGERVLSRSEVAAPGRKQTLELNLRLNGRDLQKILLEGDARGFRMAV